MVSPEWLKMAELFETLSETQLKVLLSHSSVQSFKEGHVIFRQGEAATFLYILIQGSVDLTVKAQEEVGFMTSKIEKEGAVFGSACLMEPFRYNVTAKCLKPSTALTIEAESLKKSMDEDPRMGMEMMRRLASIYFNRLNETRSGVSNLFRVFKIKPS